MGLFHLPFTKGLAAAPHAARKRAPSPALASSRTAPPPSTGAPSRAQGRHGPLPAHLEALIVESRFYKRGLHRIVSRATALELSGEPPRFAEMPLPDPG
jgi:hypothetical protein